MIIEAIKKINPLAQVTVRGSDLQTCEIEWHNIEPISKEIILLKILELENEYESKQYQRYRSNEYPDFKYYLDGIVKGDQAQIDKYIADCLAVKAKYPKE